MNRLLVIIAMLSLPVLAQDTIFFDGFENHDPVITTLPTTNGAIGKPYIYDVDATDIDGHTLLYLLTTSPAGMTIEPGSGLIEWTPDALGTYPVEVEVSDGKGGAAVQVWDIEVLEIIDSDGDGLSDDDEAIAGTDPNDPDSDDDGVLDGAEVFTHETDPLDPDTDNDTFLDGSELAVGTDPLDPEDYPLVPPDPAEVAPEPDTSVAANARDSTAFLYTGPDPIQTGVAEDTIELQRAALLRGKVLTRLGAPLPGVTVSVLGHPEFGSTLSRADGMFDLAVNGGGTLTIDYQLTGFLPAQRTVDAGWQEYVVADDVALIPLDPVVTSIDLDEPGDMKVARGSMQTDDDGSRQATILFPAGVGAELRMPDDSTMPISGLSVRATEYTVGDSGEMAMPGDLPPTSGYTYAVELSVDEAMAMGAASVDFDQPLPFYVENFLGFPAGTPVPTGYFDRNLGAWVPAPDGLVIKILNETGGMANVDIDGDDLADTGAPLADLGITDAERTQIAGLYEPGQSLWRVPVEHFTSWDHNWPIGPPADAEFPNQSRPYSDTIEDGICEIPGGSFIECQNQVLRERIPIAGTPFTLNYNGSRTPGRLAARHLDIPLTDDSNPASLLRVDVRVAVSGQVYDFSYDAAPGLIQPLTWDGLDAFGRPVQGSSTAYVRIGYVYEGVYRSGGNGSASFGQPGQLPIEIEGNRTRADFILPQAYQTTIGAWDTRGQGLGGWSLSVHHAYDARNQVLYRGDGARRSAEHIPAILGITVGLLDEDGYAFDCGSAGQYPTCGEGLPVLEAALDDVAHIAFGPDGSMYITQPGLSQVRRVGPNGILENFAGTGESYVSSGTLSPNGDGGPALDAKLADPYSIAVDPQGNVYIGEINNFTKRIRKVDTSGIITTYAGTGEGYPPIGPALEIEVWPLDMETDQDGNLYVIDYCKLFRIDRAGQSSLLAGGLDPNDCDNYTGDGGPAILASIGGEGIALGPDGSIYLTESNFGSIRKINKDGFIQTVAGTGTQGFSGDGGLAINAEFGYLYDVEVAPDGGIYVPDQKWARLRYIQTDGIVRTIAGLGFSFNESGMFGPAPNAWLYPFYVELGPDGNPYIPLAGNDSSVRVIKSPLAGLGGSEILVPSEDGSEVYKFDEAGRHLQTLHSLTGAVLLEFSYDAEGRLLTVTDGDSNVTTIQRDGSGNPTGILGPFGQVTTLAVDANGYLESITNPASESLQIQSTAGGLITQMTDPRGRIGAYTYDDLGRLISQSDNAGQSQSLVRSQSAGGFAVARTTALNRTVNYDVEQVPGTSQHNTNAAPDGSQGSAQFQMLTGTTDATSATGMTSTVAERADPRFGMQAPLVKSATVNAPGGPTLTVTSSSEAELSDPNDPFSLISLTDTIEVDGRTTTNDYTAAIKTLVQTSPEGRVTTQVFDDQGRVVSSQFGDLAPVTASFNMLGQLETLTSGTGMDARTTTFTYGADGFRDSITDPLGRTVSYARDAAGRVMAKTLPGSVDILFSYDLAGDLDGLTPPGQSEHQFAYTLHGQLQSVIPPVVAGTGPTTYAYNDDRQLTGISRPGNEGIHLSYDDQGRIQNVELIEGGMSAASYDYSYVTADQLGMITGPGAQTVSFSYQGDLPTGEAWAGVVEGSVTWTYDSAFRIDSETVTGGTTVSYTYDDDDLLTGAGAFAVDRHAANGLAQSTSLGVVSDAWTYNGFGEITGNTVTANAVPVYNVVYTRDDLGRITQKVETIDGLTDTYDYEYDPRGQLIEVQKNSVVIESYSYDDNGNRLSATVDSVTSNGNYDAQDRLLSYGGTTYAWSPSGRLQSRTEPGNLVTTYDYDAVGNLRRVTMPDATDIAYGLDGLDRRVQQAVDSTISYRLLYDGYLPLAELDDLGNVVSQFIYAGGHVPAYLIKGGVEYRLVTDAVGSVRLVVNAATGAIAQRLDYDSFGNVLLDTNPGFQPFGFAGGLYDPLTGLTLFGTRDYDPFSGRWAAKDPTTFGGEDTNLYRYANNNPINLADPFGTDFWDKALGFLNGFNEGVLKAMNPALAITSATESLTDWLIGDWLDRNGFYRERYPGMLNTPPEGVDTSDYLDGHFWGECTADVASLGVGGGAGAAPRLGSLGARLGTAADKLRRLPELAKGLGNGLRPLWDEALKLGKKALDDVVHIERSAAEQQKFLKGKGSKFDKAKSRPGAF